MTQPDAVQTLYILLENTRLALDKGGAHPSLMENLSIERLANAFAQLDYELSIGVSRDKLWGIPERKMMLLFDFVSVHYLAGTRNKKMYQSVQEFGEELFGFLFKEGVRHASETTATSHFPLTMAIACHLGEERESTVHAHLSAFKPSPGTDLRVRGLKMLHSLILSDFYSQAEAMTGYRQSLLQDMIRQIQIIQDTYPYKGQFQSLKTAAQSRLDLILSPRAIG